MLLRKLEGVSDASMERERREQRTASGTETVIDHTREGREDSGRRVPDTETGGLLRLAVPHVGDHDEAGRDGGLRRKSEDMMREESWSEEVESVPREHRGRHAG